MGNPPALDAAFDASLCVSRLDGLRHRLVPLYRYGSTEEVDCEDEELAVSTYIIIIIILNPHIIQLDVY